MQNDPSYLPTFRNRDFFKRFLTMLQLTRKNRDPAAKQRSG